MPRVVITGASGLLGGNLAAAGSARAAANSAARVLQRLERRLAGQGGPRKLRRLDRDRDGRIEPGEYGEPRREARRWTADRARRRDR